MAAVCLLLATTWGRPPHRPTRTRSLPSCGARSLAPRPSSPACRRCSRTCRSSAAGAWMRRRRSGRRAARRAAQVGARGLTESPRAQRRELGRGGVEVLRSQDALTLPIPDHPPLPTECEAAARLRLQQAEMGWAAELQRAEGRLSDATAARAKLEQQVSALTQVRRKRVAGGRQRQPAQAAAQLQMYQDPTSALCHARCTAARPRSDDRTWSPRHATPPRRARRPRSCAAPTPASPRAATSSAAPRRRCRGWCQTWAPLRRARSAAPPPTWRRRWGPAWEEGTPGWGVVADGALTGVALPRLHAQQRAPVCLTTAYPLPRRRLPRSSRRARGSGTRRCSTRPRWTRACRCGGCASMLQTSRDLPRWKWHRRAPAHIPACPLG
jgi:hypothetical protein